MNNAVEKFEIERDGTNKGIKKMSTLVFGVDVLHGDHIPYSPASEGLRRINDAKDLQDIQGNHPNVIVVIDRSQPWLSVFTVPAWKKSQERYDTNKMQALQQFNTTE